MSSAQAGRPTNWAADPRRFCVGTQSGLQSGKLASPSCISTLHRAGKLSPVRSQDA